MYDNKKALARCAALTLDPHDPTKTMDEKADRSTTITANLELLPLHSRYARLTRRLRLFRAFQGIGAFTLYSRFTCRC